MISKHPEPEAVPTVKYASFRLGGPAAPTKPTLLGGVTGACSSLPTALRAGLESTAISTCMLAMTLYMWTMVTLIMTKQDASASCRPLRRCLPRDMAATQKLPEATGQHARPERREMR